MTNRILHRRIVIIGSTSSGKSTLAKSLADRFGYVFIELDALHWERNWNEAPLEVFRQRVEIAIQSKDWVVAGNYHVVRDLIWPKADAIIWLDYSFWLIFRQLLVRTLKRWWYRELLWETNYENLWTHFKLWSQDSLIHWLFRTYWRRKQEYPILLAKPEYQHLHLYHFHHPQETQQWLESLK